MENTQHEEDTCGTRGLILTLILIPVSDRGGATDPVSPAHSRPTTQPSQTLHLPMSWTSSHYTDP